MGSAELAGFWSVAIMAAEQYCFVHSVVLWPLPTAFCQPAQAAVSACSTAARLASASPVLALTSSWLSEPWFDKRLWSRARSSARN